MRCVISRELKCILSLSFCFLTLYAADFTMLNIQKTLVSSIADEQPGFHVDGYTVSAITYAVFTFVVLFIAPYVCHAVGPRLTMFVCSIGPLVSLGLFLVETAWVLYLGAVVAGVATGTIWPAQSHYMIHNSAPEHTSRNASLFWFTYMFSTLIGNTFVYYSFQDKKYINRSTRRTVVYSLLAINAVAVVAFVFLPKSSNKDNIKPPYGPIKTLKLIWSLMKLKRTMWLCVFFAYVGLQQALWQGIYSTSLGFTLTFGDSVKGLVPLSGIVMSFGSVAGALIPMVCSGWLSRWRWGRRLVVVVGGVATLCTALVATLYLPNDSVFGNTEQQGMITPPSAAASLFGSFTITLGDSMLNTQIYSVIGDRYRDVTSEAYALYKFVKNIFVSLSFFWCSHLGLHVQVGVMAAMAVFGVVTFCVADWDNEPQLVRVKISQTS